MMIKENQAMMAEFYDKKNQIPFGDAVKRIQLALKADWYFPREPFQLNGEVITDFRATAGEYLKHVAEKEYHDRLIELAMQIPPLRTASKKIGDQLDRQLVNWRELVEASLCAIYWTAIKDQNAAVYEPLGKYLGFYQFERKSGTANRKKSFDKNWRDTAKHTPQHIKRLNPLNL